MSFIRQRTKYSCGASSLRYALTFLGKTVDEKDLRAASRTTSRGADEEGIARAARRNGCIAVMRTFRSFATAYRHLMRYVQSGQPCILCVDGWKHWVTVAGASRRGVALFDPYSPGVAALVKISRLQSRWKHIDQSDPEKPFYFFIAIRPANGSRRTARVIGGMDRAMIRELRKRGELRQGWNQYLQDLMDIFDGRRKKSANSIPAWRFIQRNRNLLVELVSFWDGALPKSFYQRELQNMADVSRAHGFQMSPEDEKSVLISLACILSHQTPAA